MCKRGPVCAGDVLEEVGYDGSGEGASVFLFDVGPAIGGCRVRAEARVWHGEEAFGQAERHWKKRWLFGSKAFAKQTPFSVHKPVPLAGRMTVMDNLYDSIKGLDYLVSMLE